jgi:hypothetical protein
MKQYFFVKTLLLIFQIIISFYRNIIIFFYRNIILYFYRNIARESRLM